MAADETLGDAYVNIMGNLSPLDQSFRSALGKTSAFMGKLAAMVGVPLSVGMLAKEAVGAWMGKEVVINDLSNSLKRMGANVDLMLPNLKEFAKQVQQTTLYSEEETMAVMAHASMLGIESNKLEETTRAAIGLAAVYTHGDLGTAMQLIIRASQGHTNMLFRYGIQLDQNATKQQKYAQLLKIGADSMGIAEGKLNTLSGQLKLLKNAWQETLETIGQGLTAPLSGQTGVLKATVKEWGTTLKQWSASGVLSGIGASLLAFVSTIWTFIQMVITGFKILWTTVMIPINLVIDSMVASIMLLIAAAKKLAGIGPDKSWSQIGGDWKRQAGASLGDIGKDFSKLSKEVMDIVTGSAKRLGDIGGDSWADKGGKTKPGGKSLPNSTLQDKAGEVFAFSEAWNRLQKEAAKDAGLDYAERTANAAEETAINTKPQKESPRYNPDPLNSAQNIAYMPGSQESQVAAMTFREAKVIKI